MTGWSNIDKEIIPILYSIIVTGINTDLGLNNFYIIF